MLKWRRTTPGAPLTIDVITVDEKELEQIALQFRAQLELLRPIIRHQITTRILPNQRRIDFNFVHNRYAEMRITLDKLEQLLTEAQLQPPH